MRGTAMAVYFLAMYLSGGSFGSLLAGHLSDWRARVERREAEAAVHAVA